MHPEHFSILNDCRRQSVKVQVSLGLETMRQISIDTVFSVGGVLRRARFAPGLHFVLIPMQNGINITNVCTTG